MKRSIAVGLIGTVAAVGSATAMAAPHPAKPAATHAQAAGVASVADAVAAYAELRRPANADDTLRNAPAGALVRRVGATKPTYLLLDRSSNRLCVVLAVSGKDSGGSACSIAEGPRSRPPILLHLVTPAGGVGTGRLIGAVPDGVGSVVVTDAAGSEHRLAPADNVFTIALPGLRSDQIPVRRIAFAAADGSTSQVWPVVR